MLNSYLRLKVFYLESHLRGFRIFMGEMVAFLLLPALAAAVAYLMVAQWGIDTPAVRDAATAGYLIFADVTAPVLLAVSLFWMAMEIVNKLLK
jgi:hypothetical protein